jgi:maltose-binding protein MalE
VVRGVVVDDPFINQVSTAFSSGTPQPILPQMAAYWEPLNNAIIHVVNEGWNPYEALKVAESEVRAKLDQLQ